MLYELICGHPPFQGRSLVDTIHAVVHDDPPRPRSRRKDLPRALETVAMRAMERDPSMRYGTAEALSADLERFTRGEPLATSAPGIVAPAWRLVRRHRSALSGVLIGAAVMMAVFLSAGRGAGDADSSSGTRTSGPWPASLAC